MRAHASVFGRNGSTSFSVMKGRYRANAIVGRYEIGPGYDPAAAAKNLTSDWAVLTISTLQSEEFRPLEMANAPPAKNSPVVLPGFAQDHAFVLTADTDCHIVGTYEGGSLIVSDCVALHGNSGAPIISADADGNFRIVGVQTGIALIGGVSRSIGIAATSPGTICRSGATLTCAFYLAIFIAVTRLGLPLILGPSHQSVDATESTP